MSAPAVVAGNPLMRAQFLLGNRVAELRDGWRLDGRPASTAQIVAAANDVADQQGCPRIAYPGVAEVQRRVAR